MDYFSDKNNCPNDIVIPQTVWAGVFSIITRSIRNGSLGLKFPALCDDSNVICGTDAKAFFDAIKAHIPNLPNPLMQEEVPEPLVILDSIEFIYKNIAKQTEFEYHGFFHHSHFSYDEIQGKNEFRDEINTIFKRNKVPFVLTELGIIERVFPETVTAMINNVYNTGDLVLDHLLRESTNKIKSPDINERRIALEKLWDSFERIKSLENPSDKKSSTQIILNKAASEINYRKELEDESVKLTRIGNEYRIRHSEKNKIEIVKMTQIDYFFFRCFSFIYLLLKESGRL